MWLTMGARTLIVEAPENVVVALVVIVVLFIYFI